MWPNPQETADLVTFTEEILNGQLYFFSAVLYIDNFYGEGLIFDDLGKWIFPAKKYVFKVINGNIKQ